MGLADMLIKMEIPYGSRKSIEICDMIGSAMISNAIESSAELAKEYGAYPKYTKDVLDTPFYKVNGPTESTYVNLYGLRNSQLLTCAPTGTLSTMLGISGGIEPIFANYYTRKTESLHGEDVYYKVYTPIVDEYMKKHGITDDADLPEWFVTSGDIDYKDRIEMQSIWQNHIDASISSTINLPQEATVEDVENIYMLAHDKHLKGVTIYRSGCKREGILVTEDQSIDEDMNVENSPEICTFSNEIEVLPRGYILEADDDAIGKKRKLITGCGSLHCSAFFDPVTGDLLETYLSKGSTGGCNNFMIGLSRMISLAARGGVPIESIVDQLNSCGTCPSYAVRRATKGDTSKGSCCPIAIGNALKDMYDEMQAELGSNELYEVFETFIDDINKAVATVAAPKCPQCGEHLIFEGGCNICKSCGYSKCD
jgi:ribonucleoside-diphosphate reductase alpha chain